jgi:hypothetical protein
MKTRLFLIALLIVLASVTKTEAKTNPTLTPSGDILNYYKYPDPLKPLTVDPHKWEQQPLVNSWPAMELATKEAMEKRDGYGLFQLAYLEFVHQYTYGKLDPKTMLYNAYEIGKTNGDPYLMYWVTDFEGVAFFFFEYLDRRRNHAMGTDSVATEKRELPVLYMLADLNEKNFQQMKALASQYIQCAYLKNETYALLNYDVRKKAQTLENLQPKK